MLAHTAKRAGIRIQSDRCRRRPVRRNSSIRKQTIPPICGFRTDQLDDPVDSFSGGWRMRLQLARALMCPADLMLLDEPTNHLDLDALVWLEAWLKRFDVGTRKAGRDQRGAEGRGMAVQGIDPGVLAAAQRRPGEPGAEVGRVVGAAVRRIDDDGQRRAGGAQDAHGGCVHPVMLSQPWAGPTARALRPAPARRLG